MTPEQEREAVVAWLRGGEVQHFGIEFESSNSAANAIQSGEHLKGKQ